MNFFIEKINNRLGYVCISHNKPFPTEVIRALVNVIGWDYMAQRHGDTYTLKFYVNHTCETKIVLMKMALHNVGYAHYDSLYDDKEHADECFGALGNDRRFS